MKNGLILLITLILFYGCSSDEEEKRDVYTLAISPSEMIFKARRDTCYMDIIFNRNGKKDTYFLSNIKIDIPQNWCRFYYNQDYMCMIVEPNTTNAERSQRITFTHKNEFNDKESLQTSINVRQRAGTAATFIKGLTDTIAFRTNDIRLGFTIETDGLWSIKNAPEWCVIEPLSGNGKQYIQISRTKDTYLEKKETNLIFSFAQEKTVHLELWGREDAFLYIPSAGLSNALKEYQLFTTVKSLKLKGGMTGNDFYTLKGIPNLRNLDLSNTYIADQTGTIPSFAFTDCSLLENIIFPKETLVLGAFSFSKCINLKEIVIPEKVIKISDSAFSDCNGLKKIKLPSTLLIIQNFAFRTCPLTEISIKAIAPPQLSTYTFSPTTYETATLFVPKGCLAKYRNDIGWGQFKNILESSTL